MTRSVRPPLNPASSPSVTPIVAAGTRQQVLIGRSEAEEFGVGEILRPERDPAVELQREVVRVGDVVVGDTGLGEPAEAVALHDHEAVALHRVAHGHLGGPPGGAAVATLDGARRVERLAVLDGAQPHGVRRSPVTGPHPHRDPAAQGRALGVHVQRRAVVVRFVQQVHAPILPDRRRPPAPRRRRSAGTMTRPARPSAAKPTTMPAWVLPVTEHTTM